MLIFIKQHLSKFEAEFRTKLSNTDTEFKNSVAYIKKRVINN